MKEQREGFINLIELRGTQFWCGHVHKSHDLAKHCRKAFLVEAAERNVPLKLMAVVRTFDVSAIVQAVPPIPAPVASFPPASPLPKLDVEDVGEDREEEHEKYPPWARPTHVAAPALAPPRAAMSPTADSRYEPRGRVDTRIDPNPVCRFGLKEGQFLSQIPLYYLKRHALYVEQSIADPTRGKWRSENEEYLVELQREIDKRLGESVGA